MLIYFQLFNLFLNDEAQCLFVACSIDIVNIKLSLTYFSLLMYWNIVMAQKFTISVKQLMLNVS